MPKLDLGFAGDLDRFDRYDQMLDAADVDLLRRRRSPKPKRSDSYMMSRERKLSRDEWERSRSEQRRVKRAGGAL